MKESKARLVKRLEKIFAVEDDFPGYLGNPQNLGAFVACLRPATAASTTPRKRRARSRKTAKA